MAQLVTVDLYNVFLAELLQVTVWSAQVHWRAITLLGKNIVRHSDLLEDKRLLAFYETICLPVRGAISARAASKQLGWIERLSANGSTNA